jgi:hypothetical protein
MTSYIIKAVGCAGALGQLQRGDAFRPHVSLFVRADTRHGPSRRRQQIDVCFRVHLDSFSVRIWEGFVWARCGVDGGTVLLVLLWPTFQRKTCT